VHGTAPHGHWNSTTVIGAMRLDGSTACMAIEGATDVEVFGAYVRQVLSPLLKPGDLVVMDNLAAHKSEGILAMIRQAGAEAVFLPAYSPDLNPIEKMWSKLKQRLRSLEARTLPALMTAIGQALEAVTPQDTLNWFASCGYSFI
jgi:transposase